MYSVYLICAEIGGERVHKIGYTRRTPEQRIKEFKTGNASDFYIVDSFKSKWGTKIEAALHRRLKPFKINGEWFQLNDEQVKSFGEECKLIHDGLEIVSKNNTYYLDRGDF